MSTTETLGTLLAPSAKANATPRSQETAVATIHADMHPGIYVIALLTWAAFLSVFWVTFSGSPNALFMVGASTCYAAVFFGVPYVMSRVAKTARPKLGVGEFLQGKVDTLYGPVGGLEALLQVILVPAALTLGGVAMGMIIHSARLAY